MRRVACLPALLASVLLARSAGQEVAVRSAQAAPAAALIVCADGGHTRQISLSCKPSLARVLLAGTVGHHQQC